MKGTRASRLTLGERMWLWRKELGLTQADGAYGAGVSLHAWRRAERGLTVSAASAMAIEARVPVYYFGKLAAVMVARLLRRRSRLTLAALAEDYGVSRVTYLKMERERAPGLIRWLVAGR